jgi:hypothetical protein
MNLVRKTRGHVYTFDRDRDRGLWSERPGIVQTPTFTCLSMFGRAVAISGNGRRLAVSGWRTDGAIAEGDDVSPWADLDTDNKYSGAVWIYDLSESGQWLNTQMLTSDRTYAAEILSYGYVGEFGFGDALAFNYTGSVLVVSELGRETTAPIQYPYPQPSTPGVYEGHIYTYYDDDLPAWSIPPRFARLDASAANVAQSTVVPVSLTDLFTGEPVAGVPLPALTISKAGAPFAACNLGTWTEVGSGLYTVTLDATDTDSQGPLVLRVSTPRANTVHVLVQVGLETEETAVFTDGVPWLGHRQKGQIVPLHMVNKYSGQPATGVLLAEAQISKMGGAFTAMDDGTLAEVGYGLYTLTLSEQDTSDLGWCILRLVVTCRTAATYVLVEVSLSPREKRADYIRERSTARGTK